MKTPSILVPTNFSPVSNYVLPLAEELAHREKSMFSMLHVYDGEHMQRLPTYRDFAVNKMRNLLVSHHMSDWPHRCYLRQGSMGDCIKKLTRQQPISLVVMGKNGAEEDIESDIVFRSACPVLAVPPGGLEKGLTRIVYVTEHVSREKEFIREAVHFASLYDADLSLLSICDYNALNAEEREKEKISELLSDLHYEKVFREYILAGNMVEGLKKYLQYNRADIVAVAGVSSGWLVKSKSKQYMKQLLAYPGLPLLFINHHYKN